MEVDANLKFDILEALRTLSVFTPNDIYKAKLETMIVQLRKCKIVKCDCENCGNCKSLGEINV